MGKFRKIRISNANPEKRVGAAFALIGFIGLYAFLLHIWAGNAPDLPALAAILLLIILGLGMHRRTKRRAPAAPPVAASAKPSGKHFSLFKRKPKAKKEKKAAESKPPPPPKKKRLPRLLRLPGRK